jgi:predicted Ser/Thr protein kinase
MKLTYNDIQLSKSSESLQSSSSQPIVANKKRISPTTPSPNGEMSSNHPIRNKTGKTNNQPRGMLESVLESQSTTTSLADVVASSIPSSQFNPPSSSSSSPVPLPPTSSNITQPPSPKKCLTVPSEPAANHGMDNAEGNLIVFEGDVIQTTKLTILKGNTIVGPQLKVLELLGQGTFAQVFLCECPTTHSRMAVKIVKNKPAYTRQAGIEIEIFQTLADSKIRMVQLDCYFIYQNHLCLVFELLGMNLYEVLKGRQFRGLPLPIVKALIRQAVEAIRDLSAKSIVHCDLKPENILLDPSSDTQESFSSILQAADTAVAAAAAAGTTTTPRGHSQQQSLKNLVGTPCTEDSNETNHTTNPGSMSGSSSDSSGQQQVGGLSSQRSPPEPSIKLIDFGSACFEGHTTHTYIQSRFYRSPEVLVGVPYDSAIDMWSLGCVAAELFLGLPILPGVHEHDQLGRISEMIGSLPDWMLEQGYVQMENPAMIL